jgi:hypothetical protein
VTEYWILTQSRQGAKKNHFFSLFVNFAGFVFFVVKNKALHNHEGHEGRDELYFE